MSNKVGVVIPSFNQGQFLEKTIISVLALKKNLDIYIALVDGGSTDNSLEIIEKYKAQFVYCRSRKDDGQAAAINEGMGKLKDCEYVCWLNSDDVFLENGLKKMKDALEKEPNCVMVYGKAKVINKEGLNIKDYETIPFDKRKLAKGCFICQPATLIRRWAWYAANELDSSLHMCMDYDLWWKLSCLGEIKYLDDYVACSRDYATTKSNTNQSEHFKEAFKILKRNLKYVPLVWIKASLFYEETKSKNENYKRNLWNKICCNIKAIISFFKLMLE